MITHLQEQAINTAYTIPSNAEIAELKAGSALCEIQSENGILVDNTYYKANYAGTLPSVLTRAAILKRLQFINKQLAPHYGLFIYDVFRTITTQRFIYDKFTQDIQAKRPQLKGEALIKEVRQYVSNPDDAEPNYVPPHNSGGAVDLAIYDRKTGEVLDFGAEFDETETISHTQFFEAPFDATLGISEARWCEARKNRRVLFHLMRTQGFVSLPTEWWHFDLGDILWKQHFKLDWSYGSLEQDTLNYINEFVA